ncbi:MAG: TIM barrel protein [Verrucomicrobiota bacterium]
MTLILPSTRGASSSAQTLRRLGVCIFSYGMHWRAAREGQTNVRFKNPLQFLEYCHELGAGGVQVGLGAQAADLAKQIRGRGDSLGMYFEGQTTLPQNERDLEKLELDVRACKEAGASVIRSAALSGRRYETFDSEAAFQKFTERAWHSLQLAEPIFKKHQVRLALENHKDWRVPEMIALLKRLGSEWVGVCVDTGNNLALLEDPMAVVETLAPLAFSSHLKDMGVLDYSEGFLLSEVPLGSGFLDVKRIVDILRRANPKLQFNLEMITRDPLKVPCLTEKYWTTMPDAEARQLASALERVRRNASRNPLPRTTGMTQIEQLELEDQLVRKSFEFARKELSL